MKKYVSVEDVMSFINTLNRWSSNYFIADKIEYFCKHKAKTLEELNIEQKEQDELKNPDNMIAAYSYEHDDGDQSWTEYTKYHRLNDGTFRRTHYDGYYGKTSTSVVNYNEIVGTMTRVEREVQRQKEAIAKHGYDSIYARGGYVITVPLQKKENIEVGVDSDLNSAIKDYLKDYLEKDAESVFKKNHVSHCHFFRFKQNNSISIMVTFSSNENFEERKKNVTAFLNDKGIYNIHFCKFLSRNVDMDWNLLYSSRLGLVDKDFFEKKDKIVENEEDMER